MRRFPKPGLLGMTMVVLCGTSLAGAQEREGDPTLIMDFES